MTNHDLKDLRDKLNGSIPHDENEEELQQQWNAEHQQMEDERNQAEFERSFVECGR